MILVQRQILNSLNTSRSDGLGDAFICCFVLLVYGGTVGYFHSRFRSLFAQHEYFGSLSALTAEKLI